MNPALGRITPSLIREVHARRRPGDVDLSLGEPVLQPNPTPFAAAMERVRASGTPYTANAGLPELRQAVARYHGFPGMEDGSSVCITAGSEEALYLAVKTLVDPALDEALVVEPGYLAYAKLCTLEGIRHRPVRLSAASGFAPSAAPVLEALRPETRLVFLNTPCNPTGRVWPDAELRALAAGLRDRPGPPVWVVVDEVYRELHYGAVSPASLAAHYPCTVTVGSLSKSNALTGMRVGWMIGDAEVVAAAVKVHGLVTTAACTFSQWVALEVFRGASLGEHRPLYAARREALLRRAAELGVDLIPPEGAFYALLRLPPALERDSVAAARSLLEGHRVLTVPGVAFGSAGEGWLRISWAAEERIVAQGLARISAFLAGAG